MKIVILTLCALFFSNVSCWFFPKVKTVDKLEINKYLGRWYEMYSSLIQRSTFQKNSYCTTATYSLRKDGKTINVYNSARISSPTGKKNSITGTATRPNPDGAPGDIVVNFPGSPQSKRANYLVVKLGPPTFGTDGQYEYTIISSQAKLLSWILARDPKTFREKYKKEALKYLYDNGYRYFWNKPRETYQDDDCLYPKEDLSVY